MILSGKESHSEVVLGRGTGRWLRQWRQLGKLALLALISTPIAGSLWAAECGVGFSFVVIGHLRSWESGRTNSLLVEVIDEVGRLQPDLVFLVGDSIWGDVNLPITDPEIITRDWDQLDSELGRLGIPIHRVPGNHDIHDPTTRDVYQKRYGTMPQALRVGDCLFLLLGTTFVPQGDGPARKYITASSLDPLQIDFLRQQLDSAAMKHVFLFMHHVLWWHEDAHWWTEVHPLLVDRNVRAVFTGDLGPTKFSHQRRDQVEYLRTAIEDDFSPGRTEAIEALKTSPEDFLLSQQVDNFLFVAVGDDDIQIRMIPIGTTTSGKHSPDFWRVARGESPIIERWNYDPAAKPKTGLWNKLKRRRRSLAAAALVGVLCFCMGVLVGAIWSRARGTRLRAKPRLP